MKPDPHYLLIADFYDDRTAERSGVPLINHINQGLVILNEIRADQVTRQAWCLHPMLQGDKDYQRFEGRVESWRRRTKPREVSWRAVMLAMEYRAVANAYLSTRTIKHWSEIDLGPDQRVQDLLVADKVQNRKDFEEYHLATHPRSVELQLYFKFWMKRLGIEDVHYKHLCELIDRRPRL